MKRILTIFAMVSVLATSCTDESKDPRPNLNDHVGAVTLLTIDTPAADRFFDFVQPLGPQSMTVTLDVDGFDLTNVSSVDVEIVYTDLDGFYNEFKDEFEPVEYDPVKVAEITSFPGSATVSGQMIADALGVDIADFDLGDTFNMIFPVNTEDGRQLRVALNSDLCNEPAQPSFGGCNFVWAISCQTEINAGTFDGISNGTSTDGCPSPNPVIGATRVVTVTDLGGGQFSVSDFHAGTYESFYTACYGHPAETTGTIIDVCNVLTVSASDGWGCQQAGSGTIDPVTGIITYTWSNCWGDTGDVTLTPQ